MYRTKQVSYKWILYDLICFDSNRQSVKIYIFCHDYLYLEKRFVDMHKTICVCPGTSCGTHPVVVHTDVTSGGELYQDTANYACSSGYRPATQFVSHGNDNQLPSDDVNNSTSTASTYTLTCQSSKQWTGNTPTCNRWYQYTVTWYWIISKWHINI